MRLAIAITILVTLCNAVTLRAASAGSALLWLPLLFGYLGLSVFTVRRFHKQQQLALLLPRRGDISIGVLVGFFLLATAWLVRSQVIPPGSVREGWLFQIHALIGPIAGNIPRSLLLLLLTATEELVWRGLVVSELQPKLGPRRAFPVASLLYAAALLPTVWTLADPTAGLNPLLVLCALGAGLVWTFLVIHTKRLFAAWVSHAVFTYFATTQIGFWQLF